MLVGSPRYGQVIVLCEARARDDVQPVGITVAHGALLVQETVITAVDRIVLRLTRSRVIGSDGSALFGMQRQTVVVGILLRVQPVVQGSKVSL